MDGSGMEGTTEMTMERRAPQTSSRCGGRSDVPVAGGSGVIETLTPTDASHRRPRNDGPATCPTSTDTAWLGRPVFCPVTHGRCGVVLHIRTGADVVDVDVSLREGGRKPNVANDATVVQRGQLPAARASTTERARHLAAIR